MKKGSTPALVTGAQILVISLALVLAPACASMTKGGSQNLPLQSEPTGAHVLVSDMAGATVADTTTPCTVKLKRGRGYFKPASYRLFVEKPGYMPLETKLEGKANGWYIGGNLVLGGLLGYLVIDPITGAMWTLKPQNLQKKDSELPRTFIRKARKGEKGLIIILREEVPASVEDDLEPVAG